MGNRRFITRRNGNGISFVIAEIVSPEEEVHGRDVEAVIPEAMVADPTLAEALRAWQAGDDRVYARSEAKRWLGDTQVADGLSAITRAAEVAGAGGVSDEFPGLVESVPTLERIEGML